MQWLRLYFIIKGAFIKVKWQWDKPFNEREFLSLCIWLLIDITFWAILLRCVVVWFQFNGTNISGNKNAHSETIWTHCDVSVVVSNWNQ